MGQDNRILILDLLEVLQKHSNEHNRLTQQEIISILQQDFGYETLQRKTVKNNLEKLKQYTNLVDAESIAERSVVNKATGKKQEVEVYSNFFYKHPFQESEMRLMIDGILFSKHMTASMKKGLIDKLERLASKHFNSRKNHILSDDGIGLQDEQLFENISKLDEAISISKKISFTYNRYSVNARYELMFEPEKSRDGQLRTYVVNPYQMAATNGRYYLICNNDRFDNLSYYRIDRISNITIQSAERKSVKKLDGFEQGLLMQKHMKEHIYLFSGELIKASIRFQKKLMTEFVDWFGVEGIYLSKQTQDEITATVSVNRNALRKWAIQYGLYFRVIEPEELVQDIKADIENIRQNYE